MAGQGDVLSGRAELHRDADFVDHLARTRSDDVATQNTVGLGISDHLDETLGLEHRLRARIAHEGEFADLDRAAGGFRGFLGQADRGDFRRRIDHARNDVVVHMAMFAGDDFGGRHALVFGFVGQHRAGDRIADRIDARHRGLPMVVDLDEAAIGHGDACRLEAQTFDKGTTAGCDQNDLGRNLLLAVVLFQRVVDGRLAVLGLDARNRRTHGEFQTLFGQNALELLLYLAVHAGGDHVEVFDHGDIAAQSRIDRAELEPDHARADHHHRGGDLAQSQRAGRIDDDARVIVHRHALERRRHRTGRDDDVLGLVDGIADADLACRLDHAPALEPVDLVLLEEEFDALGIAVDRFLLVGLRLGPIDLHLARDQAHFLEILVGFMQHVAGMEQRFRGDAADVEAGTAKGLATLDAGNLEAELCCADGADIAAGAGADDDQIIGGHWELLGKFRDP